GSVPFDRSTVMSTRTAGMGASVEDLAPRQAPMGAPTPTAQPSPEVVWRNPREQPRPRRVTQPAAKRGPECPECNRRHPPLVVPDAKLMLEPSPSPAPSPEPRPPLVVN